MAIKIVYKEADDAIVEDLEDAVEDIMDQFRYAGDMPLMVFDISTGITYDCRWSVTLRSRGS